MLLRHSFKNLLIAATVALMPVQMVHAQDRPAQQVDEKDIFKYLDQSILWYRHVTSAETANVSSREILLLNSLQQSALRGLRYSFDYARIQADFLQQQRDAEKEAEKASAPQEETSNDDEPQKFNPVQAKINITARIETIQKEMAENNIALSRANAKIRPTLTAKGDKLTAELNLAKTQAGLIDAVLSMSTSEQQETMAGQIDNLAKAIPELAQVKKKTTDTAAKDATAPTQNSAANTAVQMLVPGLNLSSDEKEEKTSESKGVIGLIGELISLSHQKQDLADLLDETKTMQQVNETHIQEQRDILLEIVKRSKDISAQQANVEKDTFVQQGQELAQLNEDFQHVSDVIVPLSKQRISLRNSAQSIENWQGLFTDEMSQVARRLLTRSITLIIMIIIPFVLSEIARRGLSQYVQDARRRRQLNIMRRVFVGIMIGFIMLFNMVSEFSSMATFIGFVTAGLAVALQNVILSIVAFFFFFGRFGIKVGSRVTVNSVTGDVIETGFVRLYLMELMEEKGQYRPTGRIVAFPNSILFQPTAFFKQVPGVSYRWHEMTYQLQPDTERAAAEKKLKEIVDSVYKDSKGMIDMQKAAMEQSTRLRVKEPRPDGKIERTAESINMIIRYPVDVEQAETTDKSVIRQVTETLERLPVVKALNDEPPVIKRR